MCSANFSGKLFILFTLFGIGRGKFNYPNFLELILNKQIYTLSIINIYNIISCKEMEHIKHYYYYYY